MIPQGERNVVVTGVAGFVGSAIAHRLLQEGYKVRGVDVLTDYYDRAVKTSNVARLNSSDFPGQFEFLESDLASCDLSPILEDAAYIFHEAGQPGVRASWGEGFNDYVRQNVIVTQRLLECVRQSTSLRRFVYASSSSVYGDAESYPTGEDKVPAPRSPYGVTKLAAEHLCSVYGSSFNVPTVSLRYFTVYGPGQRPDMAFTRFLKSAVIGESIELYGDGSQIRDFTYIEDVVNANFAVAFGEVPRGEVYNVCGGSNISINVVLGLIGDLCGHSLKIERLPVAKGDVFRTAGDSRKIEKAVGWKASTSVDRGLEAQWLWAVEQFA